MNTRTGARRRKRTAAAERAELLLAFDRSGLSAAAFARQHGLNDTTFCNWRQRQDKSKPSPGFVPVELTLPETATELVIELSPSARVRLRDVGQIGLAVRLLHALNLPKPC